MGSFAGKGIKINNLLQSEDVLATKFCLEQLGAKFKQSNNNIEVLNPPSHGNKNLACDNSGTTLRLLTGIASLFAEETVLMGDDSLNKRPVKDLAEALAEMGAIIETQNGFPPVHIKSPVKKYATTIQGNISSQFISSLLILGSLRNGESTINITKPIVSFPYIELTIQMLKQCGIKIITSELENRLIIKVFGENYIHHDFTVPSDFSSAAFYLVAGVLGNNKIKMENMLREYVQADMAIVEIIKRMGGNITSNGDRINTEYGILKAIDLDIKDSPDLFPILCVLASNIEGIITISGAHHLKYKETDRIKTTTEFLQKMGVDITPTDDGAIIKSSEITGGCEVRSYGDHRIAMAATIAASLAKKEVIIHGAECVSVSYPEFFDDFQNLGGKLEKLS